MSKRNGTIEANHGFQAKIRNAIFDTSILEDDGVIECFDNCFNVTLQSPLVTPNHRVEIINVTTHVIDILGVGIPIGNKPGGNPTSTKVNPGHTIVLHNNGTEYRIISYLNSNLSRVSCQSTVSVDTKKGDTKNSTYTTLFKMSYGGTDLMTPIKSVDFNTFVEKTTDEGNVRLVNAVNGDVICEVLGISSEDEDSVATTVNISNLPTEKSLLLVQAIRVGGGNKKIYIDSVTLNNF